MAGHPGRMERLRGTALTSAEQSHKGFRTGGRMGSQRTDRSSLDSRYANNRGTSSVQHHSGNFKSAGIYKGRRGEPQDAGPRKSSSNRLNRGGTNGQSGRMVRGGITHRTVDVID